MGRKKKFSRLLLFAAMLSTIGAGVLGSVPLLVKAAETEETYTVNFEPYEGTCETESVTVPKGESIILPEASYEGFLSQYQLPLSELCQEMSHASENEPHGLHPRSKESSSYAPHLQWLTLAKQFLRRWER